ncbi:MAG: hypothetical protein J7K53_00855 [Bacteroidales bacterium]|nr:hypothetical protein [Bacteroidales bacterium]
MPDNKNTFKILREKRGVPEHVKEFMKADNKIKREIKQALKEEPRTIKQIAKITGLQGDVVTYYLMTMIKYGEIIPGEMDDMDEYYLYTLKK